MLRPRGQTFLVVIAVFAGVLIGSALGAGAARADGWSSGQVIEEAYSVAQVSCASSSLCAQVGGSDAAIKTSSGWGELQVVDPDGALVSVSCPPGSDECVALDSGGNTFIYADGTWSAASRIADSSSPYVVLSCPTTSFCLAVDNGGDVAAYANGSWTSDGFAMYDPEGISCANESLCVIVSYGEAFVYDHPAGTGGWTQESNWRIAPNLDSGTDHFGGVSCLADGDCFASDLNGYVFEYSGGIGREPTLVASATN